MNKNQKLFHYTTKGKLEEILKSHVINAATKSVPTNEKPCVWLSFRQDWEPTATPAWEQNGKVIEITFHDLVRNSDIRPDVIPSRIEVDPEKFPLNWSAYRKQSGVSTKYIKGLEEGAIKMGGNIFQYRVSFEPIGSKDWLNVELFLNGEWVSSKQKTP